MGKLPLDKINERPVKGKSVKEDEASSSFVKLVSVRGGEEGEVEFFSHQKKMREFWEVFLEVFSRLVVRDEDESDASESPEEAIINEIFPSKAKRYSDLLF